MVVCLVFVDARTAHARAHTHVYYLFIYRAHTRTQDTASTSLQPLFGFILVYFFGRPKVICGICRKGAWSGRGYSFDRPCRPKKTTKHCCVSTSHCKWCCAWWSNPREQIPFERRKKISSMVVWGPCVHLGLDRRVWNILTRSACCVSLPFHVKLVLGRGWWLIRHFVKPGVPFGGSLCWIIPWRIIFVVVVDKAVCPVHSVIIYLQRDENGRVPTKKKSEQKKRERTSVYGCFNGNTF